MLTGARPPKIEAGVFVLVLHLKCREAKLVFDMWVSAAAPGEELSSAGFDLLPPQPARATQRWSPPESVPPLCLGPAPYAN